MKCSIPEISWHNREPVLSADIQPLNVEFYRLATGGSDTIVLIWKLKVLEDGSVDVSVLAELTRHQRSVNVVKFSPNGDFLASGDDDANIILWQLKTDNVPSLDDAENQNEERWSIFKTLRGHKEDVYDLAWAPNSHKLLSGSVDNTAIVWDVNSGKSQHILTDHKGFVQGVSWDPYGNFLATLSSDRVCRVFDASNCKVRGRIFKGFLSLKEDHELFEKEVKYFYDDTFKSYFRRLTFSPDGTLLIVPSGSVETELSKNCMFGTFLFTLDNLKQPIALLPSNKQCSIVAKCCPKLFELRKTGPKPIIDLPYRMVIAVATDSDIIIYDTQQKEPCIHLQNIHYTRLTDLTWSHDCRLLVASSTDGFVTFVTFAPDELGKPYVKEVEITEPAIIKTPVKVLQSPKVTPSSKTKQAVEITSSQKKKKKTPSGNMSLLNFIKPLSATQSSPVQSSKKSEMKPLKLFGIEINNDSGKDHKIEKVSNGENAKEESPVVPLIDDSTCEDLDLRIEESPKPEEANKQMNLNVEKENSKNNEVNVELKLKRRIPLITLSSPKNKKKK